MINIKQLCDAIDERKEELFDLLTRLININSESFGEYGNEEECARYIDKYCKELGLDTDIFSPLDIEDFENHIDYMPGRGLENRYNVVARWKGNQNIDELMLMAHTDTVRIGDLKEWDCDPLTGLIKDGKIFGRGANDDKYAIATVLFIIKILKEQGFVPKAHLLFSAYSDEEYGGSHGALSTVIKYPCKRIVSLDGDEGQVWQCASGGGEIKYLFHTKDTVDSAKTTALAIGSVMEVIEKFAKARLTELQENKFYAGTIVPETSLRYMGVKAGDSGADLGKGEVYFVFYTDKTKDEIYDELSVLEKELREKLAPLGIIGDGFVPVTRFFHYAYCEPDCEDIKLMLEASREAVGKEPIVCGSCLSDLSIIAKYAQGTAFGFGCGRDFSLIGGAHQPNEYIECDKFVEFTKTIAAYILKILG